MSDIEIIQAIEKIKTDCRGCKDGGMTFIETLTENICNTSDLGRKNIMDFFLREIESNNDSHIVSLALEVVKGMQDLTIAPDIEKIFRSNYTRHDDDWRYSVITTLMILRYNKPKDIYNSFVEYYLQEHYYDSFWLLVLYCKVDIENAMSLLSDYYANNLCSRNAKLVHIIRHFSIRKLIDVLVEEGGIASVRILIDNVAEKNTIAGKSLKILILESLKSDGYENVYRSIIQDLL